MFMFLLLLSLLLLGLGLWLTMGLRLELIPGFFDSGLIGVASFGIYLVFFIYLFCNIWDLLVYS